MEKTLPFDIEAENAVLCCMFMDNKSAVLGCHLIKEEDFFSWKSRTVFHAISDIIKSGGVIDVITIKFKLEEMKQFERLGGIGYIAEVSSSVGNSVGMKNYISIVLEKSERRKAIELTEKIQRVAYSGDYEELLDEIDKLKTKTIGIDKDIVNLPDILEQTLKKAFENKALGKKITGIKTGFFDFDLMTGGLQNGNLIIIAGRPSMGKTAFALDIVRGSTKSLKEESKVVVIFSLEMSKESLSHRIASAEMRISNEKFKLTTFTDEDFERMVDESKEFEEKFETIFIDDTPGISTRDIFQNCHKINNQQGKEIGLIVIDYIQIMEGNKKEGREREISGITRELKNIARKFNCPVIALSQLSRSCEQRADKRPLLSDLRDSGAIEQDADLVTFLYRDEYYFPKTEKNNIAELIISKQRDGAVGTIELAFIKNLTTFRNISRRY